MNTYDLKYAASWVNTVVGLVASTLAAASATAHPSWLTADVAMTCALIVPITIGLAALLPPVTRTPGSRDAKYIAATQGVLPNDLADKHPNLIPGAPPTRPLDTL